MGRGSQDAGQGFSRRLMSLAGASRWKIARAGDLAGRWRAGVSRAAVNRVFGVKIFWGRRGQSRRGRHGRAGSVCLGQGVLGAWRLLLIARELVRGSPALEVMCAAICAGRSCVWGRGGRCCFNPGRAPSDSAKATAASFAHRCKEDWRTLRRFHSRVRGCWSDSAAPPYFVVLRQARGSIALGNWARWVAGVALAALLKLLCLGAAVQNQSSRAWLNC